MIGEEFWVERDGVEFMRIYGNFTEHDYQMEVNGVQVASVHRKWVSVRDTLEVLITGDVGSPSGDRSCDCYRTCRSYRTHALLRKRSALLRFFDEAARFKVSVSVLFAGYRV